MRDAPEQARSILVTGSRGLIGRPLCRRLRRAGFEVRELDVAGDGDAAGDVRDADVVQRALARCVGVIHLAAVSRVASGQDERDRCWSVNVDGTQTIVDAVRRHAKAPWILFASSREVYGASAVLPVGEHAPIRPVNAYGRSKAEGEALVAGARSGGLNTAIVRLSNVYGSADDHRDRVVPAFAREALSGGVLRIAGPDHTFDFTHVSDVVAGLEAMVEALEEGRELPAVHLVSGGGTSLGELATLAIEVGGTGATVHEAAPRSYEAARFIGDPERAAELLGWRSTVNLRDGLAALIMDMRAGGG